MRLSVTMFCVLALVSDASAIGRRRMQSACVPCQQSSPVAYAQVGGTVSVAGGDALDQVNALRSARGLPAFVRDDGLVKGALACAVHRASNRIHGHTSNDFAFLPPGSSASVGGCSAVESSWGFLSCAMWDRYTYAGAASVMGSDGLVYHQLFVR